MRHDPRLAQWPVRGVREQTGLRQGGAPELPRFEQHDAHGRARITLALHGVQHHALSRIQGQWRQARLFVTNRQLLQKPFIPPPGRGPQQRVPTPLPEQAQPAFRDTGRFQTAAVPAPIRRAGVRHVLNHVRFTP